MRKYGLLAIIFVAVFASCEKEDSNIIPKRNDIFLTRSQADIMESGKAYAFDLFRIVVKDKGYGNVFLSPFSAQIANCMLANGAAGETFDQIVSVTGYDGYSTEEINDAYNHLVNGLKKVDTSTDLYIANSLWLSKDHPISDSFKTRVENGYDAHVGSLDFNSKNAVKTINDWVSKNTKGNVTGILDNLNSKNGFVIVNALYFKGKWKNKFASDQTKTDSFYTLSGTRVNKKFMRGSQKLLYGETSDGHISFCEIPYGNEAFVLDVVLPDTETDFSRFVEGLSASEWDEMFTYKQKHTVNLTLPKFKLEMDLNLVDYQRSMGMILPYEDMDADFSLLTSKGSKVQVTKQKATVEVDENGTTAAAVVKHKGGDWNLLPGPADLVEFKADHPFVFLIREITSDTILFIGTLTE